MTPESAPAADEPPRQQRLELSWDVDDKAREHARSVPPKTKRMPHTRKTHMDQEPTPMLDGFEATDTGDAQNTTIESDDTVPPENDATEPVASPHDIESEQDFRVQLPAPSSRRRGLSVATRRPTVIDSTDAITPKGVGSDGDSTPVIVTNDDVDAGRTAAQIVPDDHHHTAEPAPTETETVQLDCSELAPTLQRSQQPSDISDSAAHGPPQESESPTDTQLSEPTPTPLPSRPPPDDAINTSVPDDSEKNEADGTETEPVESDDDDVEVITLPDTRQRTVGEIFRDARESTAQSIESVAQETRLKSNFIVALESDDYTALPAEPYASSLIKKLCTLYGLQEGDMLTAFNTQNAENRQSISPRNDLNQPPSRSSAMVTTQSPRKWLAAGLTVVVVATVVVALYYGFIRNHSSHDVPPSFRTQSLSDSDIEQLLKRHWLPLTELPSVSDSETE